MKRPWLKFYPADWRADPRLRLCSLAARGLWIELIGFMHEGEPYGHLMINGVRPRVEDIAGLVGRPQREVEKAFGELFERGVCECAAEGAVFSRRMVRDNARAEEGRAQVNKRWARAPHSPPDSSPDRAPIRSADSLAPRPPITQSPDARIQNEKDSRAVATATRPDAHQFFESFWQAYPRRDGANPKAPAEKKFLALIGGSRALDAELAAAIVAGARRYAEEMRRKGQERTPYVAQAMTWLNQRRWTDDTESPPSNTPNARAAQQVFVAVGTPQWAAWGATRPGRGFPQTDRKTATGVTRGWWFASEWPGQAPPASQAPPAENAPATIPATTDAPRVAAEPS